MMTVHEVSRLTGVSIRTLQYYDAIGLLRPAEYTEAGYRLYDERALERLQQIMLFRALEFPLEDIKKILESPGFDRLQALNDQIALLKELVPDAKTVGVLYTSSEPNSVLQAKIARESIEALGMRYTEVTVTGTNDVQQAVQRIVGQCDAIYIPTDNVFASSMAIVSGVTAESKTPVICGEEGMASQGGLATLGISYYDLGYQTGLMAIDVLNGADVAEMPIQFATGFEYYFNQAVADEIGFEIPEKYQAYAK